eukprot:Rmarinus@m.21608
MSTLQSMKASTQAREADEKRLQDRKRNTLVLIIKHLCDYGYIDSAGALSQESGLSMDKLEVADNMDLLTIVQEFEDFYELKFNKKPKFVRKSSDAEASKFPSIPQRKPPRGRSGSMKGGSSGGSGSKTPDASSTGRRTPEEKPTKPGEKTVQQPLDFVSGGSINMKKRGESGPKDDSSEDPNEFFEQRLLKPLPDMGYNSEMRELAQAISRDIIVANPDVRWDDIVDLHDAKRLLKEAVIMPMQFPQFFTGLLAPWRGVLLFGPPGTGKTMLAKAVATECKTTFFNISASSIVSKWRGDSEKLVRVLFDLAAYYHPSTIFLDEIDSIMSSRDGGAGEHEASRRMKTELLIQMDGLARQVRDADRSKTNSDRPFDVFVLAASNLPWSLDPALLRRLEKRIHVGMPTSEGRKSMLMKHLETRSQSLDYDYIVKKTEHYSGSDLVLVCKEAAMRPLRRLFNAIETGKIDHNDPRAVKLGPVTMDDMHRALRATRPSTEDLTAKYLKFERSHGSGAYEDEEEMPLSSGIGRASHALERAVDEADPYDEWKRAGGGVGVEGKRTSTQPGTFRDPRGHLGRQHHPPQSTSGPCRDRSQQAGAEAMPSERENVDQGYKMTDHVVSPNIEDPYAGQAGATVGSGESSRTGSGDGRG